MKGIEKEFDTIGGLMNYMSYIDGHELDYTETDIVLYFKKHRIVITYHNTTGTKIMCKLILFDANNNQKHEELIVAYKNNNRMNLKPTMRKFLKENKIIKT